MEEEEEFKKLVLIKNEKFYEKLFFSLFRILVLIVSIFQKFCLRVKTGFKNNSKPEFFLCYHQNREVIICRAIEAEKELIKGYNSLTTANEILISSGKKYPNRKCLGRRKVIRKIEATQNITKTVSRQFELGEYEWLSYEEVLTRVKTISKCLIDFGFNQQKKMCLFCNSSPEWIMMANALLNISSPVISIHTTFCNDAIIYALNLTEVQAIMVDENSFPTIIPLLDQLPNINLIILSRHMIDADKSSFKSISTKLQSIEFFLSYKSDTDPNSHQPNNSNDTALIMFSSGVTGITKGGYFITI
uniref:long-chain-fatty-acid--CoA ligase n=1 Tax=Henneguya salminicola TaxID=69463 RepID=A0A6G3MG46_HENSL